MDLSTAPKELIASRIEAGLLQVDELPVIRRRELIALLEQHRVINKPDYSLLKVDALRKLIEEEQIILSKGANKGDMIRALQEVK
jgi:hypothetical protein